MANLSKAFGSRKAAIPHTVQRETGDLRKDAEEGFLDIEQRICAPMPGMAMLRLNVQPTATDTVTIGADVYEFVATLGLQTGAHIGVLRGASAAAALANFVAAINGSGVGTSVSSAAPTVNALASVYFTDFLMIQTADKPGGSIQRGIAVGSSNIALSETLTDTATWNHTNLGNTLFNGTEKRALVKIVVDATNLAADFDVVVPFTPTKAALWLATNAAGAPNAATTVGTLTIVQARNAVTVDLNGGATDPIATDIIYLEVVGF